METPPAMLLCPNNVTLRAQVAVDRNERQLVAVKFWLPRGGPVRLVLSISAAGLLGFASPSVQAQAREPAGSLATIDPSTAESGDRVSKMIGATVVNDQNET